MIHVDFNRVILIKIIRLKKEKIADHLPSVQWVGNNTTERKYEKAAFIPACRPMAEVQSRFRPMSSRPWRHPPPRNTGACRNR